MGNIKLKKMKFAVAALLFASASVVKLQDDCGGKWCNQGLPYDLDEGTLKKLKPIMLPRLTGMSTPSSLSRSPRTPMPLPPLHPRLLPPLIPPPEPPSLLLLLTSLPLPTRTQFSTIRKLPTVLPFTPRRTPSMPHTRLMMTSLPSLSLWREDREISIPLLLPRLHLMLTCWPTRRELLSRRINFSEVITRIDLSSLMEIPPSLPLPFRADTGKDKLLTETS